MKALAAVVLILIIILFFRYTQKPFPLYAFTPPRYNRVSTFDAVDPTIIQSTIKQIQENAESLYPVTTVYFNEDSSKEGYEGRFIFMDSKNYAGVQYDVTVDGSGKLTSASKGIPANFENPFTGFVNKFKFGDLNTTDPKPDMQSVWNNYIVTA
jgi:hypothetical protein